MTSRRPSASAQTIEHLIQLSFMIQSEVAASIADDELSNVQMRLLGTLRELAATIWRPHANATQMAAQLASRGELTHAQERAAMPPVWQ